MSQQTAPPVSGQGQAGAVQPPPPSQNSYGVQIYPVNTPSGGSLPLQTPEEADWYDQRRDQYISQNRFPNVSDLLDLDRLLQLEIMTYRWGQWISQGFDYMQTLIDQTALQKQIREYSREIRDVKVSLGIDKVSRDKDKGECHDDQTEVLTEHGWRLFRDVAPGERVATRSMRGELEYQVPVAYIEQDFEGDLFVVETNRLNFAVTPNHRMLYQAATEERLVPIEDMRAGNYNYKLVKTATVGSRVEGWVTFPISIDAHRYAAPRVWTPQEDDELRLLWPTKSLDDLQETFERSRQAIRNRAWRLGLRRERGWAMDKSQDLPKVARAEFARLMGFWLAEGEKFTSVRGVQTFFTQMKPDGVAWVDALLARMEWPHKRWVKANGEVKWSISSLGLKRALMCCQGDGHELRIPDEVFTSWSRVEMEALLEGMCVGDGTKRRDGYTRYSTTSSQLADDVQRLLAHVGMSGHIYTGYEAGDREGSPRANHDGLLVSLRTSKAAIYRPDRMTRRPYNGKVYCLTVPNGTLLTRRNGVMIWSGNSVPDYLKTLLERAKVFGYHRDRQYEAAVTLMYELRSMVLTHDRCDEIENEELDLSPEIIMDWIRDNIVTEWDSIDTEFRKNQKIWVREL